MSTAYNTLLTRISQVLLSLTKVAKRSIIVDGKPDNQIETKKEMKGEELI